MTALILYFGRSKLPYNKRCRRFVGYDIYDVPYGKNVYFLSDVLDKGNARHARDVASVIPYGIRFICFAFNGIYRKRFGRGLPVGEVPKGQRGAVCG